MTEASVRPARRVLIVEDEADLASGLRLYLRRHHYDVETAGTAELAIERLRAGGFELVITDLRLPGMNGLDLLALIKERWPETFVVLITGNATVETAVQAIRQGAFDYVSKPFTPQQLEVVVNRVFQHKALSDENQSLKARLLEHQAFANMVGQSEAMKQVVGILARVAGRDASVLIVGESGTGKEVVARAVHANSPRRDKPFIPVDCAALPHNLMESELFGYEKGAFTGANSTRIGLLEAAHGGTFFMDELGELELTLQVKLLRVLQERQFRRVGGSKLIQVDVRFVAATNRDLEKEVKAGRFREDLYHRLNVVQVRLPPLRERAGDIPLLAYHFLQIHAARMGREGCRLLPEAVQALESYSWPGNVRELQNAIEHAVSISDGPRIRVEDLPQSVQASLPVSSRGNHLALDGRGREASATSAQMAGGQPSGNLNDNFRETPFPLRTTGGQVVEIHHELPYKQAKRLWLETFEREYFRELLLRHGDNISHAAKAAEIDRKSIQRIMKRGSIDSERGVGLDEDDDLE